MGRDLLAKLGITLNVTKNTGKNVNLISQLQTEKNIINGSFKNTHIYAMLGRSKNHIAKPIFKTEYTPSQHKGRRVPLHLLEKVENELQKLKDDKQIIKLEVFGLTIYKPSSNNRKERQIGQNSIRFQKIKRGYPKKINTKCKALTI